MTDFSDVRIFLCTTPTNMNYSFGSLDSKQKTPKSSALQKSGRVPIIAISALLKLAEWWESRVNLAQGGESCPDKEVHLSPRAVRQRESFRSTSSGRS